MVALVLFGPDKMPELVKTVAGVWREVIRLRTELNSTVQDTVGSLLVDMPKLPSLDSVMQAIETDRGSLQDRERQKVFAEPAPWYNGVPEAEVTTGAPSALPPATGSLSLEAGNADATSCLAYTDPSALAHAAPSALALVESPSAEAGNADATSLPAPATVSLSEPQIMREVVVSPRNLGCTVSRGEPR